MQYNKIPRFTFNMANYEVQFNVTSSTFMSIYNSWMKGPGK